MIVTRHKIFKKTKKPFKYKNAKYKSQNYSIDPNTHY